jgi:hypothetical protein
MPKWRLYCMHARFWREGQYLIAGQAKSGSNAHIYANVTHHSLTPRSRTEEICGPVQVGAMPPPGTYTNKFIAHVSHRCCGYTLLYLQSKR